VVGVTRRRVRTVVPADGVRRAYVEHLHQRYAHRGPAWRHWTGVVERMEAGDEIVVHGWQVRLWVACRRGSSCGWSSTAA
jgi:hypothetical protein